MAENEFYIDLLDSAGAKIGAGPLVNVIKASFGEALDRAAECSIEVPATDQRVIDLLASASYARLVASDGYTRTAIIKTRTTRVAAPPTITIGGYDLVAELGQFTCGWLADYKTNAGGGIYGDDANTYVLPDLIANTGWSSGTIDAGLGRYVGTFDGKTRLAALDLLRKSKGKHFRQGATERTLDFGAFGSSSGFRLIQVERVLRAQDANITIGLIESLEVLEDDGDIVNLIVPFGAGQDGSYLITASNDYGKVRLKDLAESGGSPAAYAVTDIQVRAGMRHGVETTVTAGSTSTTVQVASTAGMVQGSKVFIGDKTNAQNNNNNWNRSIASITDATHVVVDFSITVFNGDKFITNPQYYLYDSTAYAANPREACIIFTDIDIPYRTPAGPDINQFIPTAYLLYERAKAYLADHKTSRKVYRVTPAKIPTTLRPGMTIHVIYHGRVTRDGVASEWVNVDAALYVLNIVRTYNGDGTISNSIEVSEVNRQRQSDAEMLAQLASGSGAMAVRV
jgi:hypothetical protein